MSVHRQPWDDRTVARFQFRSALFRRRGIEPERAERLADDLAVRDQLRDDRRLCLECQNLQVDHPKFGRGCLAARMGWLGPGVDRRLTPVYDVLQRCHRFEFVTPK